MKPSAAKKQFLQRIEASAGALRSLSSVDGIDLMLSFYADVRAEGCSLHEDGDMLLYQWGVNDWGNGEYFEFNITRQLIKGDAEDDNIKQLSLTFRFKPSEALRAIEEGNQWCHTPTELSTFREYVAKSEAYQAVSKVKPTKVELEYEGV